VREGVTQKAIRAKLKHSSWPLAADRDRAPR